MFMAVTMNSATFMVQNFQGNQNSIVNTADLTLKKMFDISAKLVGEHDEISNVDKIHWEKHSWKHLSLIRDETCEEYISTTEKWLRKHYRKWLRKQHEVQHEQ